MSPRDNVWNHHYRKIIQITSQAKGYNSMTHYNLVRKLIRMPQVVKILDAMTVVDKEWKKLETIPACPLEQVKSKNDVFLEARKKKNKVHFTTLMDICHLENAELEPRLHKYKGRVSRLVHGR